MALHASSRPDPSAWIVYARDIGWFKARRDCVYVTFMSGTVTDASYQHFLEVLEDDLAGMKPDQPQAILYDMRLDPGVMHAKRRKMLGDLLAKHDARTSIATLAYAFSTRSVTARATLQAIHWLSRPKYPATIVESATEGLAFLAKHASHLDVVELSTSYVSLVLRETETLAKLAKRVSR